MTDRHRYQVTVTWTGNTGAGTADYRSYERSFDVESAGKPTIAGSSDPAFRGDAARWNPEEMLLASLSGCHKLWYLHLCADAGLVVTAYRDRAEGTMRTEAAVGTGRFTEVVLRPEATFAVAVDLGLARDLHEEAHKRCFIANSMNFPVRCEPMFAVAMVASQELAASGR